MENTDRIDYLRHTVYAVSIFIISIIIYAPTFRSGLIWDDQYVLSGFSLISSKHPYDVFLSSGLYYRPLTIISLGLDYALWYGNPFGYHIGNVVIHALNSVLVYVVSVIILKNWKLFSHDNLSAFWGALLFSLHPIHTESVAWISGRTDLLAACFVLFAFIALLLFLHEKKREGVFLAAIFFLFSLLSKENAIVFALLAILYASIVKASRKEITLISVSMASSLGLYVCLRKLVWLSDLFKTPGASGAFLKKEVLSFASVKNLIYAVSYYYEKLLLPWNLNIIPEMPSGQAYLVLFILPILLLVFFVLRRDFFSGFWLFWLIAFLLPSLTIAVSQVAEPIGERYMYLPSVGLSFLLMMLFKLKPQNVGLKRQIRLAIIFVICLAYAILTYNRLFDWRSDFTLWQAAAKQNPHSAATKTNYGLALLSVQNYDEAQRQFSEVLTLKNLTHDSKSMLFNAMALVAINKKNYEKAELLLYDSLRENIRNVASYHTLGFLYMQSGSQVTNDPAKRRTFFLKAIQTFEESLKFVPDVMEVNFNMALCYLDLGDLKRSKGYFDAVIQRSPDSELAQKSGAFLSYIERKEGQR
ncbi:hypothetical protein [Candidatus Magnetomonas plexicatena]|uniref:hypothetical protein n=1 Tax=Candidatus Magnetomonas plexicatena TaxID=2552947 RepID=UPI001C7526BD|nr:tetratricopeptide repeat protein [Nitrospirales bacterium LBB_01]